MADAYSRKDSHHDHIADDSEDPLMALARIAGFAEADTRFAPRPPVLAPEAAGPAVPETGPQAPAADLDLEAALLAELGGAPGPAPALDDEWMAAEAAGAGFADATTFADDLETVLAELKPVFAGEAETAPGDEIDLSSEFEAAFDMPYEPQPEPEPEPEPEPVSLEDELEMLLRGDLTAAPIPAFVPAAQAPAAIESAAIAVEPVADVEAATGDPVWEADPWSRDDYREPQDTGSHEPEQAILAAPEPEPQWEPVIETPASPAAPDTDLLDREFEAAFADELGDLDLDFDLDIDQAEPVAAAPAPVDPVDELAAIMGLDMETGSDRTATPGTVPAQAGTAPMDALEDEFELYFQDDLAVAAETPSLDTVDMTPFEGATAPAFDVPELPVRSAPDMAAPSAAWDEPEAQPDDNRDWMRDMAMGGTAAVAAASAMRQAPDQAPERFAGTSFEEEMARDMEFVRHDMEAGRHETADPLTDYGVPHDAEEVFPDERPARKGLLVAAVVGCVAIVGALGVFALSGSGDPASGGPVIVAADPEPVKLPPEEPTGQPVPNQDRALFADDNAAAPAQADLVTTSEEPIDIATAPSESLPSALASGEKADDRLVEGGTESASAGSESQPLIVPRRVRTLVVRPDGTLEERAPEPEPQVAAVAPEPVAPVVAPAPEPQPVAQEPVAFNPPAGGEPVAVAPAPEPAPAPAEAPAQAAPVAVRTVTTQPVTPPVIRDRPREQPVNIINPQDTTQVAAAPAAAAPAPEPAPAAPAASSPFAVQIASLPSQEEAQRSAANLAQRYAGIIGNRGVSIQRAVIEGRGTFYRVRIASGSNGDAASVCNAIKSAGGSCFVTR